MQACQEGLSHPIAPGSGSSDRATSRLPLAMRSVAVGYDVVGYDTDELRIKKLNAAESFIEDISSEDLQSAVETGRFRASTESRSCAGFDVAIVTVPTPRDRRSPQLFPSSRPPLARSSGTFARSPRGVGVDHLPGHDRRVVVPMLAEGSGLVTGEDFLVGYSPERIDPGNRVWTLTNTPKVVSGINGASLERVDPSPGPWCSTVAVSGTQEAELAKLLENTFRHVNIALVNELAMFAAELASTSGRRSMPRPSSPWLHGLPPGPVVGGHCLPDRSELPVVAGPTTGREQLRFVELANDVNEHMPEYVVRRLIDALNRDGKALRGTRVLLLGIAYKRNTGDARGAPSATVAKQLMSYGAEVRAVDPYVLDSDVMSGIALVDATPEEIASADAVVLLTGTGHASTSMPSHRTRGTSSTRGTHSKETTSNIFNLAEMHPSAHDLAHTVSPVNDMVHHLLSINLLCLSLLGLDLLSLNGAVERARVQSHWWRRWCRRRRPSPGQPAAARPRRIFGRVPESSAVGPRWQCRSVSLRRSESSGDGPGADPRASRRASSQTSGGIAGGTLPQGGPTSVSHRISVEHGRMNPDGSPRPAALGAC